MAYEDNTGLNVHNHYGPRTTGGTEGVTRTEGVLNEFVWRIGDGLGFGFPTPGTGEPSYWVVEVDASQVTGHDPATDAQTIGGVDVKAATLEAPVEITSANTGVVVIEDGASGVAVIRYKKYPTLKG